MLARSPFSRSALRGMGFVVGLGLVVAWASLSLRLHTRPDTIHNMSHILHGEPLVFGGDSSAVHPFYNRILFPSLLTALSHGLRLLSESQWYILLRIATVTLALAAFAFTCLRSLQVTPRDLRLVTALMAVAMIASFGYPWEDPTDVLDVTAQALSVLAALEGRFLLCLTFAAFFACNRESAAYAGIVWFFLAPASRSWSRRCGETVAISLASYAVAMAIRLQVSSTGSVNWLPLPHNLEAFGLAVGHFTLVNWLGGLLAVTLLLACSLDMTESLVRRFAALAALFALPAILFGYVDDLRVFLPCAVMLCFAVAASRRIDKET
jgi:hypothetical protein